MKGSTLFKTIEAGVCIFLVQWLPLNKSVGFFSFIEDDPRIGMLGWGNSWAR